MARIFLLTPPLTTNRRDLKKSAVNNGLLYIGSWLVNRGHRVELLHTEFEGWNNIREESESTVEFGLSDDEIVRRISVFDPDVIGLTLLATVSYGGFLKVAKLIKAKFPSIPLVVGGAHATALLEKTLRESGANWLVQGEGEAVMEMIVKNLSSPQMIRTLPSVAYLDSAGEFHTNPRAELISNLDEVGDLRLELVDRVPFTHEPTYAGSANGRRYLDVFLSRGCPRNCGFCFTPQMWQRKLRRHSVEWVRRQVVKMTEVGFGHFIIQDDNFSRIGKWSVEVMKIFHAAGATWENNGGLEMEDLTPKKLEQMADTGCSTLFIPLNLRTERTDQIPADLVEHYTEVLRATKVCGMYVYTSHIMGFPEQTIEGMRNQMEFARSLRKQGLSDFHVVYAFSVLPGTKRWQEIMEPAKDGEWHPRAGIGVEFFGGWQNWPHYSINTPQISGPNFSFEQFEELFYEASLAINGPKAEAWFSGQAWPK